jgi:hypothetical protein
MTSHELDHAQHGQTQQSEKQDFSHNTSDDRSTQRCCQMNHLHSLPIQTRNTPRYASLPGSNTINVLLEIFLLLLDSLKPGTKPGSL